MTIPARITWLACLLGAALACSGCSYLMYPKVFLEYAADHARFGDMSALPTRAFFYGLASGGEVSVDIERGKTLIIRQMAISDVHDDSTRTVFFELNGQPRSVQIADRGQVAARPARKKAEAANLDHVGAPMPGTVVTVPVRPGQEVRRGEVIVTLEAMKMETAVRADRDGVIEEVLVQVGVPVDAKDLLVAFRPA